jgi:maleate cis-trans isomerase
MWACTSGSFVFGREGAARQAAEVETYLGVPTASTSMAFAEAIPAIGARRVSIAATYPDDVARAFADYLAEWGIEAVAVGSEDIITAVEVGTLGRERVLSFVAAGDHPDAEAVLVPDTALHTVEWIDELEQTLGKRVLTANQVTMWHALRLAGRERPVADGLGSLFRGGGE